MTIISMCAVLSELDLKIGSIPFPGVDLVGTVLLAVTPLQWISSDLRKILPSHKLQLILLKVYGFKLQ